MADKLTKQSKFLSYVLRHAPESIGITLDTGGWIDVEGFLQAAAENGTTITRARLEEIVATNSKKRFEFSDDGQHIRARQGHSIDVDLQLEATTPPAVLYHGTATRFLDPIREQGLIKGNRHHVHLSADVVTATAVGQRHGKPIVLTVNAAKLHATGATFYVTNNGVWLTDSVPSEYLDGL